MRTFRGLLGVGAALVATCALTAAPAAAVPSRTSQAAVDVTGTYYPVAPTRLMDTRDGLGAPMAKVGPSGTVDLQVAGRGGVPVSGVGAVVVNVTITGPTADSFVTLYPAGQPLPNASSVNFAAGWLGSNNVTVKLGTGGKVRVFNRNGHTDVVVDVVGFYAADNTLASRGMGSRYHPYRASRIFDSRTDPSSGGLKRSAGSYLNLTRLLGGDNPHARALVLNITVVDPESDGFVTAWSGDGSVPTASTVNFRAGTVTPNLAYVQTRPCDGSLCSPEGAPAFTIYTSARAHIIVDGFGMMDDGTLLFGRRFQALNPTRIVDTRTGLGTAGALGAGDTRKVASPPAMGTNEEIVLVTNVTAVTPTRSTVVTVWPADWPDFGDPSASNLNPAAGQTVSGAVLNELGPYGKFHVRNHAGSVHLVMDVTGRFYWP
ncbi:hypothetical protein ABTX15_30665 [Micromonospora sp. NPDC094482]|uniref:hypothetical protein n=1 Tax=unclassified Micromonospora TaxID=2617518 RepID=UPI0033244A52